MTDPFLDLLKVRPVIFDGAMGTSILGRQLTDEDFGGQKDCPEILVATKPEVIRDIHASFLAVGCDAVETNSFGSGRIVLGEFGLADRVHELNRKAAEVARAACDEFRTPDHPRFVAGSIGPGTRLVTLGHVTFDDLRDVYEEQSLGLLDGGADVLLIETCQDILQSKAAVIGALDAMQKHGRRVPLMVQVTIEQQGTMLLGTEIGAAMVTLEALPVDVIGLNCGTGPEGDGRGGPPPQPALHPVPERPAQRRPARERRRPGPLPPDPRRAGRLPEAVRHRVRRQHRRRLLRHHARAPGQGRRGAAGRPVGPADARLPRGGQQPLLGRRAAQDPRPLLVGERTNTNGSRKFKQLLEQDDMDGLVAMARDQEREGAHVLDVCTAYVGRDEVRTCARSSGGSTSASRSR